MSTIQKQKNPSELVEESKNMDIIIILQLGDVINISNPKNEKLNDQTFIIDYIDKSKMYLINVDTLEIIKLKISDDGIVGDGTITQIAILSRSDTSSYARQNDLLPGKWINIYFGGEYPVILTGEITNLEEDMIEIKTVDDDILYINFDYKGIPEDLPIDNIEIREKPEEPKKNVVEEIQEFENIPELEKEYEQAIPGQQIEYKIPVKNVKDQMREFILRADQIKFGDEELGPIVQYVDVAIQSQRYSIEVQLTDLLDELLSTIPNSQRTNKVLNNIHITIERFKQLREQFSTFDQYGFIESALVNESTYKPLNQYFKQFKQNLYWILPVVKNIKKIYNGNEDEENIEESSDIILLNNTEQIFNIDKLVDAYKSNDLPIDQNKYSLLYNELNPYFTPFNLINEESANDLLIEKNVETDLNVIIDNLEDMYSSVFTQNNIRSRRFVIQKYNLGLTRLDTIDNTNARMVTTRVRMTNPDTMSIKSFITLPESTIRFSKINLPGTSLLERVNLNQIFLSYWEFLKKKTPVNNIFIENLDSEIEFNENNFVNTIKNYVLNIPGEEKKKLTNEQIYSQFINTIVPKIKVLFELMKKYINGKLSIIDVVSYLEPFLIYTDDLTYMQYKEIIKFIDEKISEFNKKYIERSRLFQSLSKFVKPQIVLNNAFSIISIIEQKNGFRDDIFHYYDIPIEGASFRFRYSEYTNSEILRKLMLKDNSKLYTSAISLESVSLMLPSEYSSLFEKEKEMINSKYENQKKTDSCGPIIISKHYDSIEELTKDNDKNIYFDKKYDKTNYELLNNYEKEIVSMVPENLKIHIINDLKKKLKLNDYDADYLSNTLLDGHKMVINGQYAILYKNNAMPDYYVRKENKWVLSNDIVKDLDTDESSILCDLQEKCINVTNKDNDEDKCVSLPVDELGIQNQLLNDILSEFDEKYRISKDDFEKKIKEQFDYFVSIIGVLTSIEYNNLLKYNNEKYKLSENMDDEKSIKPISPYLTVLNLILSQNDFTKKQNDIVRFVNTYTRPAITDNFGPLNEMENINWLYCIKTNVPILPIFKFNMATSFITDINGYKNYVDLLISKIGKLSDDGDWWEDKNSGWRIIKIDFDIEEGYEQGFKVTTRATLEEDAGNKVISSTTKNIKYDTFETRTISNIVNALSVAMGINIEVQKEFIINCVLSSLRDTLESEEDYKVKIKEMAEKGKKISSYEDFYNTAILYYTLGMFLIAVQTAIPSVKTRKTHPGCVRSFNGYPFEGSGDLSSLTYLACVAFDIRESGKPWNVLKGKKTDFILNKIKGSIDSVLSNIPDVLRKMEEKTDYLLTNPAKEILDDHDITNWTQFLPPLVPFKIKKLVNVSDEFKRSLLSDLKSGSENQREKILVVDSKIIQFSLAIQEKIQNIVKKKQLLLSNSNNEPYLENSCCESKEGVSTIDYFINQDSGILEYNTIVKKLTNIIEDITNYSKSSMFYSIINTKNKYPPISNNFDEKIIYMAFIYFCKFKSLMPIPEDLLPLCNDKPELDLINKNLNVDQIIQKLKDNGKKFDNESFLRLMQLVGRKNIIHLDFDKPNVSSISKLLATIDSIDEENDEIVEGSLRKLINEALDTFDIATNETTREIKNLNDFLIRSIDDMIQDINEFVDRYKGNKITKRSIDNFKKNIEKIAEWECEKSNRNQEIKISDECLYNTVNFYKTFIANFVTIFPNIILNNVDYQNVLIPDYLKLSKQHENKLRRHINEYYEQLRGFYGQQIISKVLTTIQKSSKNILKLANITPCFTTINYGETILKPVFDERTSRFLFQYYLLRVIINYIDLTDDDEMIFTEIEKITDVQDLFTVEYLEEKTNRTDFDINTREKTERITSGNKKELKHKIAELIISFFEILKDQKDAVDISYEEILDRVFKLKEKEKNMVTDRLKNLTDEERDADTILKINKLGVWSKGLQKGLTTYVKDTYDEERDFRDEMDKIEKKLKGKSVGDLDQQVMEDYIEERDIDAEIEREAYDMGGYTEDYGDGNFEGDEVENEGDYE